MKIASTFARAQGCCEYCGFPEEFAWLPFQVDHVIAQKHGGPTVAFNLAWSCAYCNSYKGPNIAGWIAESDRVVRLFHPRKDAWNEHFRWNNACLEPLTEMGRVTVDVLEINSPEALEVRRWLRELDNAS